MPTNVEIKARARDLDHLRQRVQAMSQAPADVLHQEDSFFPVPEGRLKLRRLALDRGELIFYRRPDAAGPKASHYLLASTADPDALHAVLAAALGVRGTVRKVRELYLVGQTRVHLDRVEGLGDFCELEVVLEPGQTAAEGERVARALMAELGVDEADLVTGAYLDLLG